MLEAKSEGKQPLVGKEQARRYARSKNCRFVILSNGNLHYFWDLERGNPNIITSFPTPGSVTGYSRVRPNPQRLIDEQVRDNYIVLTQRPSYASEAAWKNETERPKFIRGNSKILSAHASIHEGVAVLVADLANAALAKAIRSLLAESPP